MFQYMCTSYKWDSFLSFCCPIIVLRHAILLFSALKIAVYTLLYRYMYNIILIKIRRA